MNYEAALVPVNVAAPERAFVGPAGRRYRFATRKGEPELQVERDGAWVRSWPPVHNESAGVCAQSPDGKNLLIGSKNFVWFVDLDAPDGAEKVLDLNIPVQGVAWLDQTRVLAVTHAEFFVCDLADRADAQLLRQVPFGGGGVYVLRGGDLVVLVRGKTVLFARVGEHFYRFASLSPALERVFERDGRVFGERHGASYELVDFESDLRETRAAPNDIDDIKYCAHDEDLYDDDERADESD